MPGIVRQQLGRLSICKCSVLFSLARFPTSPFPSSWMLFSSWVPIILSLVSLFHERVRLPIYKNEIDFRIQIWHTIPNLLGHDFCLGIEMA